jgi:hypothetical protein
VEIACAFAGFDDRILASLSVARAADAEYDDDESQKGEETNNDSAGDDTNMKSHSYLSAARLLL